MSHINRLHFDRNTQISNFYFLISEDKQICRLHVTIVNISAVDVVNSHQSLDEVESYLVRMVEILFNLTHFRIFPKFDELFKTVLRLFYDYTIIYYDTLISIIKYNFFCIANNVSLVRVKINCLRLVNNTIKCSSYATLLSLIK